MLSSAISALTQTHKATSASIVYLVPKDKLSLSFSDENLCLRLEEPDGLQERFVPEKDSPSL